MLVNSLGKSIAKATGREFVRVALGGVRDEAEIRGHRRTYIGLHARQNYSNQWKKQKKWIRFSCSMKLIKWDKIYRGDPSSALLEVLDPEQNNSFNDHIWKLTMICRMWCSLQPQHAQHSASVDGQNGDIRIAGYTEDEKIEIAKRHLIPETMKAHGLEAKEWSITDEALRDVIPFYTREAGVRNLEREIANLCRKSVKQLVSAKTKSEICQNHHQRNCQTFWACINTASDKPNLKIK